MPMSLLEKVKGRIHKARVEHAKRKKHERSFQHELSEANRRGKEKGLLERAEKQSYQQAKQSSKGNKLNFKGVQDILGKVGDAGMRVGDYMNTDPWAPKRTSKRKRKKESSVFDIW